MFALFCFYNNVLDVEYEFFPIDIVATPINLNSVVLF